MSTASSDKEQLALDVIRYHFGDIVHHVGHTMITNGPLTLPELLVLATTHNVQNSPADDIKSSEVRPALVVLLTHKLVNVYVTQLNKKPQSTAKKSASGVENGNKSEPVRYSSPKYSLDCTAAIRRLRFPHHIQYCEKHYGIAGRLIAQSLLCHSQLTAAECQALAFELAGSRSLDVTKEGIAQAWETMSKQRVLQHAVGLPLPVKHLAGTKAVKIHEQTNQYDQETSMSLDTENGLLNRKRSLNDDSDEELDAETTKQEAIGNSGDAEQADDQWTLNASKIDKKIIDDVIIQHVAENIGELEASAVDGILSLPEFSSPKVLSTEVTITREVIHKAFEGGKLSEREFVSALDSLQRLTKPILEAIDKGQTFNLRLFHVIEQLKQNIIISTITQQHGANASRIFRLLQYRGALEDLKIADLALLSAKDTRTLLYKLHQSGLIQALELPKRSYYDPNMTIFCWHVNENLLDLSIMSLIHKTMVNIQRRREAEIERYNALMGQTKSITDAQLFEVAEHQIATALTQLEAALLRVDKTLQIMEYAHFKEDTE